MSNKKGFTLIELLVVILIIGILATLVIINVSNARKSARDTKRVADLKSIQTALEMYYEKHKAYPSTIPVGQTVAISWGTCSAYGSHGTSGDTGWIPGLAPEFIPVLPSDPKSKGNDGCYIYVSDGMDFKLKAHKTMETCANNSSGTPDCNDPSNPTSIKEMSDGIPATGENSIAVFTTKAKDW